MAGFTPAGPAAFDADTAKHGIGSNLHTAAQLAELNALISDATLIDESDVPAIPGSTEEANGTSSVVALANGSYGSETELVSKGETTRTGAITVGSSISEIRVTSTEPDRFEVSDVLVDGNSVNFYGTAPDGTIYLFDPVGAGKVKIELENVSDLSRTPEGTVTFKGRVLSSGHTHGI